MRRHLMKMNAGIVREMVAGRWSDYNRISNMPCFNFDGWHTHTTLKRCLTMMMMLMMLMMLMIMMTMMLMAMTKVTNLSQQHRMVHHIQQRELRTCNIQIHGKSPLGIPPQQISHLRWVENYIFCFQNETKENPPIIRWAIARLWLFIYGLRSWDFSLKHFVRITHVLAGSSICKTTKRRIPP